MLVFNDTNIYSLACAKFLYSWFKKKRFNIFNEFKSNDVKLTQLDLICVQAFKYIVRSFKSTYKNHHVIKRSMYLIRHMRAFHTWLSHL